jgi:hypothetical protein
MLRPKTIKLADVRRALARGEKVAGKWQAAYPMASEWQAGCLEVVLLPGLWERVLRKMAEERVYAAYRDKPVRFTCPKGLPGYLLKGWNGEPREGYEASHSPAVAWNGITRNLFASLGELLRMQALGHDVSAELWDRWRVKVVA